MNKMTLRWAVFTVFVYSCAALSQALTVDSAKVPMPPTGLTVVETPTAEVVGRIFSRQGVPVEARARILTVLRNLGDEDLAFLKNGANPDSAGLEKPPEIMDEHWFGLVSSYAEATLVDRKRRFDTLFQLAASATLSLVTFFGGMWVQRLRNRVPPLVPSIHARPTLKLRRKKRRK